MMRWSSMLALAACGLTSGGAASQNASIFGEWWTPGFSARVQIRPCGETACGEITWLWDETPDGITDTEPLLGRPILSGFTQAPDRSWTGGRIYNPEDGRSYSARLSLVSERQLNVQGCVLFFCKRQAWRRVTDTACLPPSPVNE